MGTLCYTSVMTIEHGRGAWPVSGAGGTKKYRDSTQPGPYYYLGSGKLNPSTNPDNGAVRGAVKAYQRALNRRLGLANAIIVDGIFGTQTEWAVTKFQTTRELTPIWGGIGPETSKAILYPDLVRLVLSSDTNVTEEVVSGIIRHESNWDAGAVGYIDPSDLGLAQINGVAHPELSDSERLMPYTAFNFVINYLDNALDSLNGNLRDAIASYNLGLGGARRWIDQGRPEWYTPQGSTTARNVWDYIDSVLAG